MGLIFNKVLLIALIFLFSEEGRWASNIEPNPLPIAPKNGDFRQRESYRGYSL